MNTSNWFEVDRKGLAKLLDGRSKAFVAYELLANAFDENVREIDVRTDDDGRFTTIEVEDDSPDGFRDLREAYTLFAESRKKTEATLRGRFNLGEKLLLAIAHTAEIVSTTDAVLFDSEGRHKLRERRKTGTRVSVKLKGRVREEIEEGVLQIIVPRGISVSLNGELIVGRLPVASFEATLASELGDAEGVIRPTRRKGTVEVYMTQHGQQGFVYESGIPVVEIGGSFDVNVLQKVPLNMNRDNVKPAFLAELRAHVLNAVANRLTKEEATSEWVREAAGRKEATPAAVEQVMTLRFGDKRVAYDPSDPEANKSAAYNGYTVVPGGSLSRGEWENVRSGGSISPAGKVFASAKPYGDGDGPPVKVIDPADYTPGQRRTVDFIEVLGPLVLEGQRVKVRIVHTTNAFGACCGPAGELDINVFRMGKRWFDLHPLDPNKLSAIIHELAHVKELDHLSPKFHEWCCTLGARIAQLAFQRPTFIERFEMAASGIKAE